MSAKLRLVFTITIAFLSFYGSAQSDYWQQEVAKQAMNQGFLTRFEIKKGQIFSFDENLFFNKLYSGSAAIKNRKIVYFPNELGEMVPFQINEAPVLSPELSAKYPLIKSYVGHALGNSKDKIRFSISHKGIQSMTVHADGSGTTFMQKTPDNKYILYTRDSDSPVGTSFTCKTKSTVKKGFGGKTLKSVDDQVLRKLRLAVTASGEYTNYHGGTVADALAAINATVTRINEVFETDLGITLELVANTDTVIFTDAETDPYTGNFSPQVQSTLTSTIGAANYDFGILFNRADQGDGNAGFIAAVCDDSRKGSAYVSGPNPEGDLYDLDFVSHEMGHQLGANHTWSHESEGTNVQVEPGSGTTIMGYAGITGINDVASNGDDYFHYVSIEQITDFMATVSCAEIINLTNNPPVITPTGSFTIPKSTAFVLTGNATDVDVDDILTYAWEQIDSGVVPQSTFGPNNPVGSNFRSQKPSTDPKRYFPKLTSVLQGNLTQTAPPVNSAWETVSDVEREMNFALTVRDNASGGGQVVSDLVNLFIENSAGPFVVTSHTTSAVTVAGGTEEIIWDVANTNLAPINAQTVDILLSIDGGLTFPIVLAENVSNDGSHTVVVPSQPTTEARIMVKANNNIFFAVNSSDFTIDAFEIVLNFANLEHEVCQPSNLVVPFSYESHLGFSEEATFSVVTPPDGIDISFFPETATATGTPVDITFSNTQNLAVGNYSIRVLATTASLTKQITIDLNILDASFTNVTLVAPADGLTNTSTSMLLEWEAIFLATSYDIQVATNEAFTNIVEDVTVATTSFLPSNLENETTYFWRVKPENSCGEGSFGSPFSFTTVQVDCTTKTATDLPKAISVSGTPMVISKIAFFEDLKVTDININLDIEHTFLSDLLVTLTSPSGTTVVLIANSCDDLRNLNATFDGSSNDFICNGNPAISGIVKPLGSLDSFNGESLLGEWTLTVNDIAPNDGGSLKSFSMDVCVEGQFRPDADNDGVFDDGPDLCLGTPEGTQVDTTGCPINIFPNDNFSLEVRSESCRMNNDGSVKIGVKLPLDYTITVNGNGTNLTDTFTEPYTLPNLSAGSYTICITGTDGTLNYEEQCFDIAITEPDALSVSSKVSLNGKIVELQLQGSDLYNIELNGILTQIETSTTTLKLKDGGNTLKISTNLPCQGSYEEQFFVSDEPIVYPNPFTDFVKISFGTNVEEVVINIFALNGRLIQSEKHQVNGAELELDLTVLATGLYYIKFEGKNIKGTSKVIKQ